MNCRTARKHLVELFDAEADSPRRAAIEKHLATCPHCSREAEDLRNTLERVLPTNPVGASSRVKETVMSKITKHAPTQPLPARSGRPHALRPALAGLIAACILAAGSASVWRWRTDPSRSAFNALGRAVYAMEKTESIHISARMRTRGNFDSIRLDHELVPIELWKKPTMPPQWRAESPDRIVVNDGTTSTLWIKSTATASRAPATADRIGWLLPLMDVGKTLANEREFAESESSALTLEHVTGDDGSSEALLSVEAAAQGNYPNDAARNTSITSSDNLRVYRLDAETLRLKGLEVYVHTGEGDVLVFETTDIEYGKELPPSLFALDIPEDAAWYTEPAPLSQRYVDMEPDEVARAFFEACAAEDWDEAAKFCTVSPFPDSYKEVLGGLELLTIGTPLQIRRVLRLVRALQNPAPERQNQGTQPRPPQRQHRPTLHHRRRPLTPALTRLNTMPRRTVFLRAGVSFPAAPTRQLALPAVGMPHSCRGE